MCLCRQSRRAFTLLELLIVLAIIMIVVGLLLPAVLKVREAANRIKCASNLKQIGLAVHNYHDTYNFLPPSRLDADGCPSWAVLLVPYLEQDNFYQQWKLPYSYYVHPQAVRETQVAVYYCPSRRSPPEVTKQGDIPDNGWPDRKDHPGALGDYAVSAGDDPKLYHTWLANGAFVIANHRYARRHVLASWSSRTSFASLTDGLSNTFLLGEKHVPIGHAGQAAYGDGSIYNGDHPEVISRIAGPHHPLAQSPKARYKFNFGSYHPGICQFVFGDGSVRALAVSMDADILSRLAVRNDGQPIPDF